MSEQEHTRGRAEAGRPDILGYDIHSGSEGILPWSFVDERMSSAQLLGFHYEARRPTARRARLVGLARRDILLRNGLGLVQGA